MNFPILFQDDKLVAVNKPSGLLVHRTAIDRWEIQFALQKVRDQLGKKVYPVHRLDKATSGVLIFAFSSEVAGLMGKELAEGRVHKKYVAVVRGMAPDSVIVDHPLKDRNDPGKEKAALTEFMRLASCELPYEVDRYSTSRYSLVQALPKTGRMHQIRRHLKHLKHPIIGDSKYGSGKHNRFFKSQFGSDRLLLACTGMSFIHPHSQKSISITAPLAEEFRLVLHKLGWEFKL